MYRDAKTSTRLALQIAAGVIETDYRLDDHARVSQFINRIRMARSEFHILNYSLTGMIEIERSYQSVRTPNISRVSIAFVLLASHAAICVGAQAHAEPVLRPPANIPMSSGLGHNPQEVTGSVTPAAFSANRSPLANHLRRRVVYSGYEAPGTIIVDTDKTVLLLVLGKGQAISYGVGVGRDGFRWSGGQVITRMAASPESIRRRRVERQPYLPRFMAGGPSNPMGARALYLGNSVYRIHGTNDPSTIGQFVSSGCIRLLNEDIEDLYARVTVGTRIRVLPSARHFTS